MSRSLARSDPLLRILDLSDLNVICILAQEPAVQVGHASLLVPPDMRSTRLPVLELPTHDRDYDPGLADLDELEPPSLLSRLTG